MALVKTPKKQRVHRATVNGDALTFQAIRFADVADAFAAVKLLSHRPGYVKPIRLDSAAATPSWGLAADPEGMLADGPLYLLTERELWAQVCREDTCYHTGTARCAGHVCDEMTSADISWELYGNGSTLPMRNPLPRPLPGLTVTPNGTRTAA